MNLLELIAGLAGPRLQVWFRFNRVKKLDGKTEKELFFVCMPDAINVRQTLTQKALFLTLECLASMAA